ncbi:MAG: hypothetical protein ABFR36_05695 [Acidobacteriota bacterium]
MLSTQEGRDYQYYKIYIWGGLAAIVIYIFIVTFSGLTKNFRTLMIILNIPITVWFFGILAYWWWVFLYKGRRKPEDPYETHQRRRGKLSSLKSWSTLFDAMMEKGGDREEIEKYEKASRRPLIAWFGLQTLLAFWVLGNFWIWTLFQDKLPKDYIITVWTPGVLIIAMVLLLSPIFLFKLFGSDPNAYLRPLGLFAGETPLDTFFPSELQVFNRKPSRKGAAVIGGKRKGRNIYIETVGKHCFTWGEGKVPPFNIQSISGKLKADESSPSEIKDLIKGFPKAKRWKGITVTGDENGIQVTRNSRGLNMWLYDLWLAEQLFETLKQTF